MKRYAVCLGAAFTAAFSPGVFAQSKGPSTTTEPYILPAAPGVKTLSLLTVGDNVGGYRLVGVPDGLGAWEGDRRAVNLVLNHEIGKDEGIARAHGSKGAFVSRWSLNPRNGLFLSGRDHSTAPTDVFTWNGASYAAGTTAFERFCSADLAARSAYYFKTGHGRYGTPHRIFLDGEEISPNAAADSSPDHGRAFAHIVSGPEKNRTYQVPRFGRIAFENAVASPYPQIKTVVVLTDDANRDTNVTAATVCTAPGVPASCSTPPSELYVYVGTKLRGDDHGHWDDDEGRDERRRPGPSEIDRAGLTNGKLYGVRVLNNGAIVTGENKDNVFSTTAPAVTTARFEVVDFGDVSNKTGVQLENESLARQLTQFSRIEDGAWDPRPGKQRDFYFNTTGRISASASSWRPSRLWRVRFDDITRPELGGTIENLLSNSFYANAGTTPDADPNYQMFDNMAIDRLGRIVLQEDVGADNRLGRLYVYGIESKKLQLVAAHNPKYFSVGSPDFITNDEESSGVIDISDFAGDGWFLLTSQVHKASSDKELVEGGQLLSVFVPPNIVR